MVVAMFLDVRGNFWAFWEQRLSEQSIGPVSIVTLEWGFWVPFLSAGGSFITCSLSVSTVRSYTKLGRVSLSSHRLISRCYWGVIGATQLLLPAASCSRVRGYSPAWGSRSGGALPAWPLAVLDHTHHLVPEVISTDGEREYSIFWLPG